MGDYITFLSSKRFNLSSEGQSEYTINCTFYDTEYDNFTASGCANSDGSPFTFPSGSEFIVDFENNKVYVDENEVELYVYSASSSYPIKLNLENVTAFEIR